MSAPTGDVGDGGLAGSPGPHVFVESLDVLHVDDADIAHLVKSLRMRDGDALTASDGQGNWCHAEFASSGMLARVGEVMHISAPEASTTVAFSLTKQSKPEWVIQKLTELGVSRIVVLTSERTIVRWDDAKVEKAKERWERIVVEAAMQSHQVRLPTVDGLVPSLDWLATPGVAIAHFDGEEVGSHLHSIAVGPEGGWSPEEVEAATSAVTLGASVLRAETAAIAAGVLLKTAR